jgi:hypothetical protein
MGGCGSVASGTGNAHDAAESGKIEASDGMSGDGTSPRDSAIFTDSHDALADSEDALPACIGYMGACSQDAGSPCCPGMTCVDVPHVCITAGK